jgi:8-oxo-dGTP pyrophosphatase MutT (NUDIX family)
MYIYDPKTREFMLMFHRNLGAWLAPGGHIELSETPLDAALRETEEEVGLRPEIMSLRGDPGKDGQHFRRVPNPDDSQAFCIIEEFIRPVGGHDPHIHVDHIIVGIADSKTAGIKKDASEVTAHEWFNLQQIENEIETFDNLPLICRAIQSIITP